MKKRLTFALALMQSARGLGVLALVLALAVTFDYGQLPARPRPTVPKDSPTNAFKIGMFGFESKPDPSNPSCKVVSSLMDGPYPSSQLNVLAEDGFNVVQDYGANWSDDNMASVLLLVANNGLKMLVESKAFYKPDPPVNDPILGWYSFTGVNDYQGGGKSGSCDWKARPNYATLIDNVYSNIANKDIVWGHEVTEEASYPHCNNHTNDPRPYDCGPNKNPDPDKQVSVEVPPQNVFQAINYFRTKLNSKGIGHQKLIVMEANHHKSIHDGTNDGAGQYNPQDYLRGQATARADVFLEGSYTLFPQNGWSTQNYSNIKNNGPNDNWHYLGPFKSVDYAFLQVPEVHRVINIEGSPLNDNLLNSSASIKNANWLWFQAYTSIIHGADGIWFWGLPWSWKPGEKPTNWNSISDRYERGHFPEIYRNFTAPLARELRYLVNNNYLSSDPASVLFSKTDHPDDFCIVGPAATYIQLPSWDTHRREQYGLRYTIRTNGQDVIMIVTNPLPIVVTPSFDFQHIANPIIANSTGVQVLFETNQDTPTSSSYKVGRDGRVNLPSNSSLTRTITYSSGKKFSDVFGPLDVHVYKFIKGSATFPKPLWYHKALNWDAPPIADGSLVIDSDATHVFYRGIDNRIYNFWRDGSRWRNDALDYNAPAVAAGNLVLNSSRDHLFFIGTDNRVYNFWWTGTKWQLDWLGQTQIAAGNLVLNSSADHVFFISTDNRVCNYWWNPSSNKWQLDELGPAKIAAGNLVLNSSADHVFFISTDNRVCNYWWNPSSNKWQLDELGPAKIAAGNLVLNSSADHVFFISTDNRVCNYWWNPSSNKWQLDELGPAKIAAGNLVLNSSADHVFFISTDNRVCNYWWNPSSNKWQLDELGPAKIAAGNLVLNSSADHMFFISTDNRVCNYWWNPSSNKWQLDWLTPCAPPLGIRDLVIDTFGRLFYVANDWRVYTFYWSS